MRRIASAGFTAVAIAGLLAFGAEAAAHFGKNAASTTSDRSAIRRCPGHDPNSCWSVVALEMRVPLGQLPTIATPSDLTYVDGSVGDAGTPNPVALFDFVSPDVPGVFSITVARRVPTKIDTFPIVRSAGNRLYHVLREGGTRQLAFSDDNVQVLIGFDALINSPSAAKGNRLQENLADGIRLAGKQSEPRPNARPSTSL